MKNDITIKQPEEMVNIEDLEIGEIAQAYIPQNSLTGISAGEFVIKVSPLSVASLNSGVIGSFSQDREEVCTYFKRLPPNSKLTLTINQNKNENKEISQIPREGF